MLELEKCIGDTIISNPQTLGYAADLQIVAHLFMATKFLWPR
jgi:hypothetical protein